MGQKHSTKFRQKYKPTKKKTFKDFSEFEMKNVQNTFLGFRCKECFKQLKITIKKFNENKEINILGECNNRHYNETTLKKFLEDYRITITPDYKVIDNCYLEHDHPSYWDSDDDSSNNAEYLYICTICKKIFYRKDFIEHKHTLITYLYKGNNSDYEGYNPGDNCSPEKKEYFYLDFNNYLNIKNKIDEQNIFYSKLIEFQQKEQDKNLDEYISQIKDKIDFINEILKTYLKYHSEISCENLKSLFNFSLSILPENYTDDKIQNYINNIYKDKNIKYIDDNIIHFNKYSHINFKKKIEYACKINEQLFGTIGGILTIYEIQKQDKKYNFKELINIQEKGDYIHYIKNQKIISCKLKEGKINIYKFSDNFDSYEIIQIYKNIQT